MDQCQACRNSNPVLNDLECGHYICNHCLDKNTIGKCDPNDSSKSVKCPRQGKGRTCEQVTAINDIKQVTVCAKVEATSSNYDPSIKYMEPDLIKLHEEMERERVLQEQREEKELREIEQEAAKEAEEEMIYDMLLRLSEETDNCKEICGFRENDAGNRIVLDIQTGSKKVVTTFLEELFKEDTSKIKFDFVEQNCKTSFLFHTGAKIAPAGRFPQFLTTVTHPDELRDTDHMATVTCLGLDSAKKLYILTIKHVFQNGDEQKIISSYHSKLTEVSDSFRGVLANVKLPGVGGVHLIDIAAMPLKQAIQAELEEHCSDMLFTLNDWYKEPHKKSAQLKGRTVYKHGAVSGTTCGVIKYPLCQVQHRNQAGDVICKGMGFFVESKNPNDPAFAVKGDSGALIWDDNHVPIGIVSMAIENYDKGNGNIVPHATYGVRLDCCLEALKEQTGIDIKHCRAVGSPLPVRKTPDSEMEVGPELEPEPMEEGAAVGY